MECKADIMCCRCFFNAGIDLTRMECKGCQKHDILSSRESIDLTRMECKVL